MAMPLPLWHIVEFSILEKSINHFSFGQEYGQCGCRGETTWSASAIIAAISRKVANQPTVPITSSIIQGGSRLLQIEPSLRARRRTN